MLILTRNVGQSFLILPGPGLDPAMPVERLFQRGPIEVLVAQAIGARVKIGIGADPQLLILRQELLRGAS